MKPATTKPSDGVDGDHRRHHLCSQLLRGSRGDHGEARPVDQRREEHGREQRRDDDRPRRQEWEHPERYREHQSRETGEPERSDLPDGDDRYHASRERARAEGSVEETRDPRVEQAQRKGEFRDDLDPKEIGMFVNLVLNGLALQRAQGDESPRVELVLGLLEDAIGGPARQSTRPRTRP